MIAELKKTAEHKMQKSVEALQHDLAKVRTGRAHTGLLDHVMVDQSGRQRHPAGRSHHRRPAVGKGHGRQDREGDS
jgi:hypothetical protein